MTTLPSTSTPNFGNLEAQALGSASSKRLTTKQKIANKKADDGRKQKFKQLLSMTTFAATDMQMELKEVSCKLERKPGEEFWRGAKRRAVRTKTPNTP